MRIYGEVTIASRQLASSNQRQPRPARSSLGIGRMGKETCLHLCTALNKQGTHYKIAGNLEGVFTKFANEGKFTVRIKEPKVDLIVKSDPVQVKTFLQTLKNCITNKDVNKLKLSAMAPVKTSQLTKPKTTVTINNKQEYPLTVGFPYNIEHLTVNECSLTRVERRMLNLTRLKTLNLGQNLIAELPRGLTTMKTLTVLELPGNRLSRLPHDIFNGTIKNTLTKLNLSANMLEYLPSSWSLLKQLVHLNLNNNRIKRLPFTMCHMLDLRELKVSDNCLDSIPSGIQRLTLYILDLSSNPFELQTPGIQFNDLPPVPSLMELTSRSVLEQRFSPSSLATLPSTVQHHISSPFLCTKCMGFAVAETAVAAKTFALAWLRLASPTLELHLDRHTPNPLMLQLFCSRRCLRAYT